MDTALRHAWTELVSAADIDDHMHQVGQAAANAALLVEMLGTQNETSPSKLLILGGGTAQFLDYVDAARFSQFDITVSDINPIFLQRARERFAGAQLHNVRFVVDDIENTVLVGSFDVIAVVMVLEHIDWRFGLSNIQRLASDALHIIIQRNPENMASAIAPARKLNASMQAFAATAQPKLVASNELIECLKSSGFVLNARAERAVADGKMMLGLSFHRALS